MNMHCAKFQILNRLGSHNETAFLFSYCFAIENNRKHVIFEDFDLEMGLNR